MKKLFLILTIVLLFTLQARQVHAQLKISVQNACPPGLGNINGGGCNLGYTPLEPIPGFNEANLDFATLLGRVYLILITIGALFSVLMITISGVRYMLANVVTDMNAAKARIWACIYGLLLIAASYLILNTINPQLVNFSLSPGTSVVSGSNQFTPDNQPTKTCTSGNPCYPQCYVCTSVQNCICQ